MGIFMGTLAEIVLRGKDTPCKSIVFFRDIIVYCLHDSTHQGNMTENLTKKPTFNFAELDVISISRTAENNSDAILSTCHFSVKMQSKICQNSFLVNIL